MIPVLKYQLLGIAKENDILVDSAFWLIRSYLAHASFQILRQRYHILDSKLMLKIVKFFSDLKYTIELYDISGAS